MTTDVDLLVIGAGMAGIAAATKCASHGWNVVIVDSLPYGGTCALRGCDPKKILRRGAEVMEDARLMSGKGVNPGTLSINWQDLMEHKHGFTQPIPATMEENLQSHGVQTLHGNATFTAPTRIDIAGASYGAAKILVATGAAPRPLGFPGTEHVIDSTDFLNLQRLPPRIVFVGGGFISFEFAHIAARVGSSTLILDRGARPLKNFDPDLVDLLIARGTDSGVIVQADTSITGVVRSDNGFHIHLNQGGKSSTIGADLVVHGAGRVPDLSRLNLEAGNVAYGPKGVQVADHLQSTTNPTVYAAGDSADTPGMPLTPVAVFEAKVAASNMLKSTTTIPDYTAIPTTVFTIPEAGSPRHARKGG
ncbi:NAD(P)/FAD-dependent oxidoreductase [Arthrobacter sp. H20]|uniref:dihydrolipoyl dehydrogenase family protein n=1 Tax=Arthrobacter sp. H20 TaxID=1267981 RepID=UPI0004BA37E5|nr:NAD(P)/FAD-dependent oxidoreductase [Arthrobacter sp. H20]